MNRVQRRAQFTDLAVRALATMKRIPRRSVLDGIRTHLIENDPWELTSNQFPLKRLSVHAARELRLEDLRVFYTVLEEGALVLVNLIAKKRSNKLFVCGEEFEL